MSSFVRFGPQRQLVGILGDGDASRPILVLPSAGLIPRAGAFRLHVELAERLSRLGFRTFRFDVPGVGESQRVHGVDDFEATAAAIDELASRDPDARFVVGGICSGADVGWRAAVSDDRVIGMLMLDGLGFTGPWFQLARVANVVRGGPRRWLRTLSRLLRMRGEGLDKRAEIADYREWPTQERARVEFADLVARGKQQLWIYTGGYDDVFLHPKQFAWSFGPAVHAPCVTMAFWPDCDHTFFAAPHRTRLVDTVEQWMLRIVATTEARQ